uniref:G-protein coupled receptors family 1 profile domain-containing protein n=2 Tax=Xenopus tropicalis TaxID=8364 RepID=A0A6I8S6W8_XENTR
MWNVTSAPGNTTQVSPTNSQLGVIIRTTFFVSVLVCLFFFAYLVTIILTVFFTKPSLRENSRYVLFAHMLINDVVYLVMTLYLAIITSYLPMRLPAHVCYAIVMLSSASYKVTAYNLGVMALERYVAICFPLRHSEFCTRQRSAIALVGIWAIGLIPNIADCIILSTSVPSSFFSLHVICARSAFMNTSVQTLIRNLTHILSFTLVGLIIIFTYIKIMMVALRVDSGKESAIKASRTVMLHAIQLFLCLMAFSNNLLEIYLMEYMYLLPLGSFFLFMCLPRFISPLIYGIRDEVFRNYIKRFMLCRQLRVHKIKIVVFKTVRCMVILVWYS